MWVWECDGRSVRLEFWSASGGGGLRWLTRGCVLLMPTNRNRIYSTRGYNWCICTVQLVQPHRHGYIWCSSRWDAGRAACPPARCSLIDFCANWNKRTPFVHDENLNWILPNDAGRKMCRIPRETGLSIPLECPCRIQYPFHH